MAEFPEDVRAIVCKICNQQFLARGKEAILDHLFADHNLPKYARRWFGDPFSELEGDFVSLRTDLGCRLCSFKAKFINQWENHFLDGNSSCQGVIKESDVDSPGKRPRRNSGHDPKRTSSKDRKIFNCQYCKVLVRGVDNLQVHYKGTNHQTNLSQMPADDEVKCEMCDLSLSSAKFASHVEGKAHLYNMKHFKEDCKVTTEETSDFICKLCRVKCYDLVQLQTHFMEATHQWKLAQRPAGFKFDFWCPICKETLVDMSVDTFNFHVTAENHLRLLDRNKPSEICPFCGQVFNGILLSHHQYWRHRDQLFLCSPCGFGLFDPVNMLKHIDHIHPGPEIGKVTIQVPMAKGLLICTECQNEDIKHFFELSDKGKEMGKTHLWEKHRISTQNGFTRAFWINCRVCDRKFIESDHFWDHICFKNFGRDDLISARALKMLTWKQD